ncbi:MAG: CRTAC1 family protein [Myxococcota bacterium]
MAQTLAPRRLLHQGVSVSPTVRHISLASLRRIDRGTSALVQILCAVVAATGCRQAPSPPRDDTPVLPADLAQRLAFSDGTENAGLGAAPAQGRLEGFPRMLGGIAAADIDDDLDIDLLLLYPGLRGMALFENLGGGLFEEVTTLKVDAPQLIHAAGGLWLDDDGDGDLDLLITAHDLKGAHYFRQMEGHWHMEPAAGLDAVRYAVSPTAADINRDGWLDLFVTHWDLALAHFLAEDTEEELLFLLHGGADGFQPPPTAMGLDEETLPFSFAGHFIDIDEDDLPELLLASDFGESRILKNEGGVHFSRMEAPLSDEHGMGAVVFDFDNDGDQDWFVTSIATPAELAELPEAENYTGNRLYRNEGAGRFIDVTETSFLRDGGWGWGACAADFDNDGWQDLFHTNGFEPYDISASLFRKDPARLFLNLGDGRFVDVASPVGLLDDDQGRGIACFDYDDDGDVDIIIMNYRSAPRLWRNDSPSANHFLQLSLRGPPPNTRAVGATVDIDVGSATQSRVVTAGNTYIGQQPYRLHFGLGAEERVDEIRVRWPDGVVTVERDVAADQHLVLRR